MPSPTSSGLISNVSLSGALNIDALARGVKWGGALGTGVTVTYSFPWVSGPAVFSGLNGSGSYSTDNEPASSYAFTAVQQAAARGALQRWANVANIQFTEVADTPTNVGDIRFTWTDAVMGTASAWGRRLTSPGRPDDGDVWWSSGGPAANDTNWAVGSSQYARLIHEIGHVLGFKHPGNYDSGGSLPPGPFLPPELDNRQYTVMSYNEPPGDLFRILTHNPDGSIQRQYIEIRPETPMVLDIAAMQYLYGPNTTYRTGNDTYTFDPTDPFLKTIWDAGGNDTISVSNFTEPCVIDLTPGSYSTIRIVSEPLPPGSSPGTMPTYNGTNNLGIAYGAIIENAIGGSGNDRLIGNTAANRLDGGAGNDTLDGGSGVDTALYAGTHAAHSLTRTATGYTVSSGASGTDTLASVERLQFADGKVALDLNGAAGSAARIIGASFGPTYLHNPQFVGIGISLFDAGMSLQQVAELALGSSVFLQLAGSRSNAAVVTQLYRSVVGVTPPAADLNVFVGMLNGGMSQANLLVLAANTDLNAQHIDLVGLTQTGIGFA